MNEQPKTIAKSRKNSRDVYPKFQQKFTKSRKRPIGRPNQSASENVLARNKMKKKKKTRFECEGTKGGIRTRPSPPLPV